MSEYGYGYNDYSEDPSGTGEPQQPNEQGPKWFRDYMGKVSGQLSELKAENDRLKTAQRQSQVAETLKAKGYAPNAAALYQGEPEKLDDWLKDYGQALAKLPAAPEGGEEGAGEQPPAGPPASTVPAEGQAQMQTMQEAGTSGVAAPQGSEAELVSQFKNADPAEFAKIMRANGNQYDWSF